MNKTSPDPVDDNRPGTLGWYYGPENARTKTWYSYDPRGRVKWMVQKIKPLNKYFTLEYTYGPAGNVRMVAYQQDNAGERFYHLYRYDADNRLKKVFTTRDSISMILDDEGEEPSYTYKVDKPERLRKHATYHYYLHGPLKKVALASGAQQVDYTYTPPGWLKAINNPFRDGSEDLFSMSLNYFEEENSREGAARFIMDLGNMASSTGSYYNGNIRAMAWKSFDKSPDGKEFRRGAYTFNYDNQYRLTKALGGKHVNSTFQKYQNENNQPIDAFKVSNLEYDPNGNIQGLTRLDNKGKTHHDFADGYQYAYEDATSPKYNNQLQKVKGHASYDYNKIGQMVQETSMKEDTSKYLKYNVRGQVEAIYAGKNNQTGKLTDKIFEFTYDDRGNRLKKQDHINDKTTWYIRDGSGQLLSVYVDEGNGSGPIQRELPVYGNERLAVYYIGDSKNKYLYEINDHLGNVRALFSLESNNLDPITSWDYYPFGLKMKGANMKSGYGYRYGYQGEFAVDETGETDWIAFAARNYDPVTGRGLSRDPERQFFSPYTGMGNNPVIGYDPTGGICPTCPEGAKYNKYRESTSRFGFEAGVGVYNDPGMELGIQASFFGNNSSKKGSNGDWGFSSLIPNLVITSENGAGELAKFLPEGRKGARMIHHKFKELNNFLQMLSLTSKQTAQRPSAKPSNSDMVKTSIERAGEVVTKSNKNKPKLDTFSEKRI